MQATETTPHDSKIRLLDAALRVIREKGYTATRIDDICAAASVTKGSFFHHFRSKEDLALAAARHWGDVTGALFASAGYNALEDPLDRLLAYIDFRRDILRGELSEFTCLLGTMVQEVYETHPAIREACAAVIDAHAATVEAHIAEAMRARGIEAEWTARSLSLHIQAVLQGAFVLAKARGGPEVAADCVGHLRRYVECLFTRKEAP